MKILARISLTFMLLPVFLLLLFFTSLKFQILNPDFWITTFEKGEVYQKLEVVVQNQAEKLLIDQEGISRNKAQQFSKFLTAKTLKEIFEVNVKTLLNFVNGKTDKLLLFIPDNIVSRSSGFPTGQVDVENYINSSPQGSGLKNVYKRNINYVKSASNYATIAWGISLGIFIALGFCLYKLRSPGSFIFVGISSLGLIGTLLITKTVILRSWEAEKDPAQLFYGAIFPPVLNNILILWAILSGVMIAVGVIAIVIKKQK